jgi:hypothetical protein
MCDPVSTLKSVIDLAVEVYKSIEDADEAQELLRKEIQFVNSILKNSEVDDDRHLLAHDEFDQLNLTIHECVLFVHDTSNKTKAALEASLKNFYAQAKTLAAMRLSMNANTLSTPPSSPSTISETGKVTRQKAEGAPDVSDAGNSTPRKKDPGMWNPKKRLARAKVLQSQIHEHIRKINLALNMDALAFAKDSKLREENMNKLLQQSLEREKEILQVLKEIKQDRDKRIKEKEKERMCSSINFVNMFAFPSVNLLGWGASEETKTESGTTRSKPPSQKSTSPKKTGVALKPSQTITPKSPTTAPKR